MAETSSEDYKFVVEHFFGNKDPEKVIGVYIAERIKAAAKSEHESDEHINTVYPDLISEITS